MSETYLNGKITLTSLAAPSEEDKETFFALSKEDQKCVIDEALERGRNSGVSDLTMEDIWQKALERARTTAAERVNAT